MPKYTLTLEFETTAEITAFLARGADGADPSNVVISKTETAAAKPGPGRPKGSGAAATTAAAKTTATEPDDAAGAAADDLTADGAKAKLKELRDLYDDKTSSGPGGVAAKELLGQMNLKVISGVNDLKPGQLKTFHGMIDRALAEHRANAGGGAGTGDAFDD